MLLHTVVTVREQARASLFFVKTWCWRRSPFFMPAELRLQQSRPPLGPVPVPRYNSERHLFCSAMHGSYGSGGGGGSGGSVVGASSSAPLLGSRLGSASE